MKRLTMWYDGNQAICEDETCVSDCCPFADPVCDRVQLIIDRLAAIEDILGDDYGLDRLRELVEADREDAVHIGACGFCEYYQMDKFCCCPDWVEDGYAVIRKPKDYCTKFKKAGWVDEVWGENGCPSCPGHLPTALKAREQDG